MKPGEQPSRATTALVWIVWAAMLGWVLTCIARYGRNIPLAEDWTTVPALTGNEHRFYQWLWAQNNEHRVPLPRLIHLAVLAASGGDFRAGMVVNTLIVAALTAAMMFAARHLRGRSSITDAFFPLAMLNLGHWINLIWSWQIQFVSSVALIVTLLLVIVRQGGALSPRVCKLTAIVFVLLPFTGASGLLAAAALGPWALFTAWAQRGKESQWLAGGVALAALETLLYFIGYHRPEWVLPPPSVLSAIGTGARVLGYAFGPIAARSWPISTTLALVILAPTAGLVLLALARSDSASRPRVIGMICFGAAMLALALGIGWGRAAELTTIGLPNRYAMFAVPVFCWTFYVWQLYGARFPRGAMQTLLLIAAIATLPGNTSEGFVTRDWYLQGTTAVQRDIDAGLTAQQIAERDGPFLMHWNTRELVDRIEMLRRARLGPFARLEHR